MAAPMDPAVQEALLKDPKIQAMIKDAGESALKDPAVQAEIVRQCQEKFPGAAAAASEQVQAWANDPAVQEQAKQYAGQALLYAGQAGDKFVGLIEQGPAGVRFLAFIGGVGSLVNAGLSLVNPLMLVFGTVTYVVAVYQCLFAITTMLFEAPPEYIAKVPGANGYQDMLMVKAKFLTENAGRGLFYIFQGSLWLAFASMTNIDDLIVGCYLCFIGLLHVLMHFGIMPQSVAQKMRSGYEELHKAPAGP